MSPARKSPVERGRAFRRFGIASLATSSPLAAVLFCVALSGAVVLLGLPARADVLILKNGDRLEGIVSDAPGDPESVLFRKTAAQVKIPRSQVRSIEDEPDAVDWRHIGDHLFNSQRFENALEAYEKAAEFEPENQTIQDRIDRANEALGRTKAVDRGKTLARIDELLGEARDRIEEQSFESAREVLEVTIPSMNPTATQDQTVLDLKEKLHREWGLERLDKLDRNSAAKHFEEVLKLNPNDQQAYDHLIDIWSRMPEKNEQVIAALEMQVQRHPDDYVTHRRLGDKALEQARRLRDTEPDRADEYEEMARLRYMDLWESGNFRGSDVEVALRDLMNSKWRRARDRKDYDTAIDIYQQMMDRWPDAMDEMEMASLKFYRDLLATPPTAVDARTSLVLRARDVGLEGAARQEFNRLFEKNPEHPKLVEIDRLYARDALAEVRLALNTGAYTDAMGAAERVISNYSRYEEIAEEASRMRGLAQQESLREQVAQRETGRKYKDLADEYYSQAVRHMEMIYDKNYESQRIRVFSDKEEAKRNFRLAYQYYKRAMEALGPSDHVMREDIEQKVSQIRRYYRRMTGATPPLPQTRRSLGF